MNVNNIRLVVLVVVAFIALSPVSRADVPYLSGGIGVDERQQLLDKEKDYDLKIITAEASGDYVRGRPRRDRVGREGAGA